MRLRRSRDHVRDDEGVTLVLVALLMTAMLTIVAIVIDLGYVRGSARTDQSIADLAALAGSDHLENERYVEACEEMIEYLNLNANGMPAIDAEGFCGPIGTTGCPETEPQPTAVAPTATAGKYTVTIEFPVLDEPGSYPAMGAGAGDGPPCERMRVTVRSVEPAFFGGVVGASDYEVTRSATVRAGPDLQLKPPALWLLEPYGCDALRTSGSGTRVEVGDMGVSPPIEGLITIDSDGSACTGQQVTINASQGRIHALPTPAQLLPGQEPGEIRLVAMGRWATSCSPPACDAAHDVRPRPTHAPERATRAPVDHYWNCKSEYPDYDAYPNDPARPAIPIPGCTDDRPAHIDELKAAVGGSTRPAGFTEYTGSCSISGTVSLPAGDWYFPCNLSVGNNASLTIAGGRVVVNGSLSTGSSSSAFRFNEASGLPGSIYVRSGDLDVKDSFVARNTTVVLADGLIKVTGGGALTWTAPTEGPFAGLAAWAEKRGAYSLAGGANVTMAGAFFTPYANSMSVSGGGGWNVRDAQYISRKLVFSGNSTLAMAPNSVQLPSPNPTFGFLIR